MPRLLIATGNQHKLGELKTLLQGLPCELVSPADIGIKNRVAEVGITLEENARLKAIALSTRSGLISLADDSGLEVEALGGKPGVLSARYAGEKASDNDRIRYLLSMLKDIPYEKRLAKFRCVIAIATPDGQVKLCSGECRGYIALEPRGVCGFGYDPVFYVPWLGKTMAELPQKIKNRISHRGKAARKAFPLLLRLLDSE
jgi:XTP/dITP diphosphohydrolase